MLYAIAMGQIERGRKEKERIEHGEEISPQ